MSASPLPRHQPLVPVIPDRLAVKVIGLGGVGGTVARYLAVFLASMKRPARLVLIDGDAFEPSNASRMLFPTNGNKATIIRRELVGYLGNSALTILAVEEYVTTENIERLVRNGDVVLLCVDNHATRKLVNDFCRSRLNDVCLVSGGNDGVGRDGSGEFRRGTFGNVQIYIRKGGVDRSPALDRFHPEVGTPSDHLPTEKGCVELMDSVPQLLFTNLMTASCMLNALWLVLCGAIHYSELAFDIADGLMRPAQIPAPRLAGSPDPMG